MAFDPSQLAALLIAGGLDNAAAATGIAVAMAESSLNPEAEHANENGSVDRGIWQLNSEWHAEIPSAEAFDPVAATAHALRIKGDDDWTPWNAYKNGAWRIHRRLGWVATSKAHLASAHEALQDEVLLMSERDIHLTKENARLAAALPRMQERVNQLDNARIEAIERLQNTS